VGRGSQSEEVTHLSTYARETVVGAFRDRDDARDAIEDVKVAGFTANDISLLSPDRAGTAESDTTERDRGNKAPEGAVTGAVAVGILGGLGAWQLGLGALAIPGVGPFLAAGAFATALAGADGGAGVGAITGALVGMGVPEEEARYYEEEARVGRTLVAVRAGSRYQEARDIMRRRGAYDFESRDTPSTGTTTTSTAYRTETRA
jgi:hypothetical protein